MLNKLRGGTRLDRPPMCPKEFFEQILLGMCWIYNDQQRADLPQVDAKLNELMSTSQWEMSPDGASSTNTENTDVRQSPETPDSEAVAAAKDSEV